MRSIIEEAAIRHLLQSTVLILFSASYACLLVNPTCFAPCLQLPMLKQRWKLILFGVIMQYVHGIFTQLAHRLHEPQKEPLPDLGFELTPVSERVFVSCCFH